MSRVVLSVMCVALVALSLSATGVARAETVDRIVAVVDDQLITMQDVRMEGRIHMAGANMNIALLDLAPNRREQIQMLVDRMIRTRLLVAEANRLQAPIGEEEVNARLQQIYGRFGKTEAEYRALLEKEGIPWDRFRDFLRDELKSQTVIRAQLGGQVSVSEVDVEACARQRSPGGEQQTMYTVRQILVAADPQQEDLGRESNIGSLYPAWWDAVDRARFNAAVMLYNRVAAGEDFEAVARDFSAGSSRARGGLLGEFGKGDLSSDFAPVFELQPGDITDIIETTAGFHIMTVDDVKTAANPNWTRTVEGCRAELMEAETQKVIEGWVATLAEKHFVDIRLHEDISETAGVER